MRLHCLFSFLFFPVWLHYYSCDWDYDGLKIFDLVKSKVPQIELLLPTANPVSIIKSEHNSHWEKTYAPESLSDLNKDLFSVQEKQLIRQLISENSWIVEESNDIAEMIANKIINLSEQ